MFEFRLRVLDVREREGDPPSYLGIVEGFPQILVHSVSPAETEAELVQTLADYLGRLQDREATRLDWDDFPTVRCVRLYVGYLSYWSGHKIEGSIKGETRDAHVV